MEINNSLSLFEVSQKIQEALEVGLPPKVWVIGEISDISVNRSGHCYLELVEKDSEIDKPKAKARATIWARTYRMLKPFFETSTGRQLSSGIKIRVQCTISYHPLYGLSLNILDIDPTFTLGDIERVRQETINRLIADGVMNMNKEVDFPILPKRIAVISSPSAAGYEDFMHQIDFNPFGYSLKIELFKATMQGDKAEETIIDALNRIHQNIDKWDVVVLIRGGGSQIDLGCFDGYHLANNIAQFPIPIITGIGHERDITVADMVANTRLKTPTAVAEFLINQFTTAESWLNETLANYADIVKQVVFSYVQAINKAYQRVIPVIIKASKYEGIELQRLMHKGEEVVANSLAKKDLLIQNYTNKLTSKFELQVLEHRNRLKYAANWLSQKPKDIINQKKSSLKFIERNANAINPERVLTRGFSITTLNGKIIKSSSEVNCGDNIETILSYGKFESIIKKVSL